LASLPWGFLILLRFLLWPQIVRPALAACVALGVEVWVLILLIAPFIAVASIAAVVWVLDGVTVQRNPQAALEPLAIMLDHLAGLLSWLPPWRN
jgi:hypothetical protein